MATIFLIILAILVVCNWNWVEERIEDIAALGGEIFVILVFGLIIWAVHGVASWAGIFDSWILSFIVASIFCIGYYKYAG